MSPVGIKVQPANEITTDVEVQMWKWHETAGFQVRQVSTDGMQATYHKTNQMRGAIYSYLTHVSHLDHEHGGGTTSKPVQAGRPPNMQRMYLWTGIVSRRSTNQIQSAMRQCFSVWQGCHIRFEELYIWQAMYVHPSSTDWFFVLKTLPAAYMYMSCCLLVISSQPIRIKQLRGINIGWHCSYNHFPPTKELEKNRCCPCLMKLDVMGDLLLSWPDLARRYVR